MASWWRQYAEQHGIQGTSGSWARRVASVISSGAWSRQVALNVGPNDDHGSWERRISGSIEGFGSWLRRAVLADDSISASFFASPFAARSIWNIGLPAGTTFANVPNGSYNGGTNYAVGDMVTVSPDDAGEPYAYVALAAGTGNALPTGPTNNANWEWLAIAPTTTDADGGGLPRYSASNSDPTFQVRFNVNAYDGLNGGWNGMSDDAIWSTGTDEFATDYNTYSTSTADASGASPTPPVTGTYFSKAGGLNIQAPSNIATSGKDLDWTIVIRQPNGLVFEALYAKVLSGNRLIVGSYGLTDPSAGGDGIQNGFRASMLPGYAGCITADEWDNAMSSADGSSGEVLSHKLGLLMPRRLLTMTGGPAMYPALTADSQVDTANAYVGKKIVTGQVLQVDPAMLSNGWYSTYYSLNGDDGGKSCRILARTMVEQGMIALDRGGSGIGILAEAGVLTGYQWSRDVTLRLALNYLRRAAISSSEYDKTPLT